MSIHNIYFHEEIRIISKKKSFYLATMKYQAKVLEKKEKNDNAVCKFECVTY